MTKKEIDNVQLIKDLAAQWEIAKQEADYAKKAELHLRNTICSLVLGDHREGTIKKYGVEASAKLNRKLDAAALDSIWEDLTPLEKEAIVYKPSLVLKQFKTLDEKSRLRSIVTESPGQPTLKIAKGDK